MIALQVQDVKEFMSRLLIGTDFDAFAFDDVAKVCSHLNSYPRPNQGAAPIRLASLVLPVTCSRAWACAPFRPTTRS